MGDNGHVTLHSPSPPEQELLQDRTGSSHSFPRKGLSQSLTTMERDSPMNSTVQHQLKPWGSTPMSSTPSESQFPHFDQRRTPVVPDLQYPNVAPDNASWPSFPEQSAPMDQDSLPRHQSSMPRNFIVTSVPGGGGGFSNGVMDGPAPSPSTLPQRSRSLASTEPEQLRRPVEHLIKLASVREERMSRQREIFDLRSSELSTFSSEASRATDAVQDQIELVKLEAEAMRTQAGQMLQEATKTRELADRLIASVDALNVPNARKHVDHLVERSDQMTSFMRKAFDWLAALRDREQEKVNDIQKELDEQALAEINRAEKELEAEAQEKLEAARREEEERKAAKKKAEEEEEAARKKAYEEQRAAVLEQKRRASEAQAQKIQRERRPANDPGGGSNPPASVFPGIASEHTNNARASTSLSLPPVVPGSTRPPARGKGPLEVTAPLSQPPPSPNKAKTVPASVWFVPAQTEVGRTVNTDSPLSSTTLASELHPRTGETSQRPPMNHVVHAASQDQMLRQEPRRMTPMLEQQRVEIKREPSVEELPATRLQASPSRPSSEMADMNDGRQRHLAISRRTPSQDRSGEQRNQASSASGANSLYVTQTEENRRRSDPSAPVPPEQANLIHSQDSLHDPPDPRRAGTIEIVFPVPAPEARSRGGRSLDPHRLTHASGFVRDPRATIQGKLQITGSRNDHSGVRGPTGIEAETGSSTTTIATGTETAPVVIAPHRPVEPPIPTGHRTRRRPHHHGNTVRLRDLAIVTALPHQTMRPSDSLAEIRKIGSPSESIPTHGTINQLTKQNPSDRDRTPTPPRLAEAAEKIVDAAEVVAQLVAVLTLGVACGEALAQLKRALKLLGNVELRQSDSTFGVRLFTTFSKLEHKGTLGTDRRKLGKRLADIHGLLNRLDASMICVNERVARELSQPETPCCALPHPFPEIPIYQQSNALHHPHTSRRSEAFVEPDRTPSTTGARDMGGDAASALPQNSSVLQEEPAMRPTQMAAQLRRNAEHFSGALAADQGVLRAAEENVGANLDVMKRVRLRLQDHRGKALGTTCLTVSSIVVAIAFLVMSFSSPERRWEMAVSVVMTQLLFPVIWQSVDTLPVTD
ncbi:hypothetical protein EDB92DRAFT_2113815 [Lactarius akahatsu]|uniref:Uncharacterized protein n=1 Tax=Lactarius akahatsu TaxID=416441 RepID=A0AAD4QEI7_9AGAM|nr:hypothetical protein EDB92DRAFT_2113815 [Lactarius akahatsu]